MNQEAALIRERMKTPRAAATAGILFSVLLIVSMLLLRSSVPANPMGSATEAIRHSATISLALNMLPFAGIAFLWFIAVMRDRLGELEDRFFAKVFLGSGLLFMAMIFTAAAIAGGIIRVIQSGSANLVQSGAYTLGRIQVFQAMNIYAMGGEPDRSERFTTQPYAGESHTDERRRFAKLELVRAIREIRFAVRKPLAFWNYYSHHEDATSAYQDIYAPRNFHANNVMLSMRYAF